MCIVNQQRWHLQHEDLWIKKDLKRMVETRPTFLFITTWNRNIIIPCSELQMAKRYLNTIVSRLKTSSPNSHVSPSIGSSIAEPLRATFAFFNIVPTAAWIVPALPLVGGSVWVALVWPEDNALLNAKMKITELIWKERKQSVNSLLCVKLVMWSVVLPVCILKLILPARLDQWYQQTSRTRHHHHGTNMHARL